MRVFIHPQISGEDTGQGGIRRVIEGQRRHLPEHGIELVDDPAEADVIACHVQIPPEYLRDYPDKAFVHHCHGMYWAEYEWPKWANEANTNVIDAIRAADAVTVPTEWVARIVERHTCRKPWVVPHGLDLEEWMPGPGAGVPYVLWDKTRPDPVCDPRVLNDLAGLMPEIQFVSTFGEVAPNVTITGHQAFAGARELTRSAHVYLATSRETFGIATLQAMACGVPVVGYDFAGQAEIVTHMVDGYLAEPGNLNDLAAGVRWAFANRDAAGAAARATAQKYSWDYPSLMYAQIYGEALEHRRRQVPRVSFIVRAYNMGRWLGETLQSISAQTVRDWECIIVDDGSTDDTAVVAEMYTRDPRFTLLRQANGGIVDAMISGIEASRGRYVMAVDADDRLTPNAMELLAGALDKDRAIHAAYGNLFFVSEDGTTAIDFSSDGRIIESGHSGWPMQFRWDWQALGRNLLPYCTMYRREAWDLTGGHRRRCATAEDADFWLRISSYGFRPAMVSEADVLIYRVRGDSYSRQVTPVDWAAWFPWRVDAWLAPAGAVTQELLPLPSLDPPAVAVVIPVGPGHERLVMDAIDSVDAQNFRWWECIVVNDSGRELPRMPSWVRLVESRDEQDRLHRFGGVAQARNAGIASARAAHYLPLDADDMLEPTALQVLWEAHKERPDVILYTDFWQDQDGKWTIWRAPDWDANLLLSKGAIAGVTELVPVRYWHQVGGYPEDTAWEDWAFKLLCAEAGFCSARVARPLFTYRKHTGRRSSDNWATFERSKADMMLRFGDYWSDGNVPPRRTLLACGCSGNARATAYPPAPILPDGSTGGDMALIRYDGERIATFHLKGPSGTQYHFAKGEELYALAADEAFLLDQQGFAKVDVAAADQPGDAPILQSAQTGSAEIPAETPSDAQGVK